MATHLVALPEVERLSTCVLRILGANPGKFTLQGTNTYLLGRGQQRILIDTGDGKPAWAANLQKVLHQERATVQKALITHWHGDHVNGIPDLLRICPKAIIHKHQPEEGQLGIDDGQVFSVEGATLTARYTPGHAFDHMVFLLKEEDAIFTGDNVLGHGTSSFEDLKLYISSLRKMLHQVSDSGRGYPGHGAVIPNANSTVSDYIQHRQQREDEIIGLLRSDKVDGVANNGSGNDNRTENESNDRSVSPERTSWDLPELVDAIYPGLPDRVRLAASHGVMQVLMKLEGEGRAECDGVTGKWRLSGGSGSGRPAL